MFDFEFIYIENVSTSISIFLNIIGLFSHILSCGIITFSDPFTIKYPPLSNIHSYLLASFITLYNVHNIDPFIIGIYAIGIRSSFFPTYLIVVFFVVLSYIS
jgi:hypothetical protein